jgi:hypothetical protein
MMFTLLSCLDFRMHVVLLFLAPVRALVARLPYAHYTEPFALVIELVECMSAMICAAGALQVEQCCSSRPQYLFTCIDLCHGGI